MVVSIDDVDQVTKAVVAEDLMAMIQKAIVMADCKTVQDVQWLIDGMITGARQVLERSEP